jgi:acyl carrier protein
VTDPLLEDVKRLIREQLGHYVRGMAIGDDTLLFEEGLGLDSVAAMELLTLTETHFGVTFQEEDLTEELMSSPRALAALLRRRGAGDQI